MDYIIECESDTSVELALEDPEIREPFDKIERLCINAGNLPLLLFSNTYLYLKSLYFL